MHHCFTITGLICSRKWRKKHDYENLKDFIYQVGEVNKAVITEKEDQE